MILIIFFDVLDKQGIYTTVDIYEFPKLVEYRFVESYS